MVNTSTCVYTHKYHINIENTDLKEKVNTVVSSRRPFLDITSFTQQISLLSQGSYIILSNMRRKGGQDVLHCNSITDGNFILIQKCRCLRNV